MSSHEEVYAMSVVLGDLKVTLVEIYISNTCVVRCMFPQTQKKSDVTFNFIENFNLQFMHEFHQIYELKVV